MLDIICRGEKCLNSEYIYIIKVKWRTIEFQYKINSKHSLERILGEILIKNRLNISGVQTTPKQ